MASTSAQKKRPLLKNAILIAFAAVVCWNCNNVIPFSKKNIFSMPPGDMNVPGNIIFITGGARSGKSRYAQELALQLSSQPVYAATARHWDDEFETRIQRHQQERDSRWTSIEEEKHISQLPLSGRVIVIDCITLWLTNFFVDLKNDVDACLADCKKEIDQLQQTNNTYIIISNEIGMGVHAETAIGRKFTDLQGWMNQYIAQKAGKVIFMVSGIPMTIK
jgi:adenosylcobinamide kinase / adenosylcobinamide-phosphate guanylyltransferase